jgi:Tol biopolymer transport system component
VTIFDTRAVASLALLVVSLVACGAPQAPTGAAEPTAGPIALPALDDARKVGATTRPTEDGLWLILSDGTWLGRLTAMGGVDAMSWSPDGRRIVFDAADGIYVIGVDGSGLQKLVGLSNWVGHGPAWSPVDDRILISDGRLALLRTDGSDPQLLPGPVPGAHASWSPDGTRIAFAGTAPVQPWDIFTVDADGTHLRDLTDNDFYEMAPSWSPDASLIAYGAAPGNDRHVGVLVTTHIFVINPDGSGEHDVTRGDPATPGFPSWLPDGRLSFITQAGELWIGDAEGSNMQAIARVGGPVAWRH